MQDNGFSDNHNRALKVMAMVDEMAIEDGWSSLDECTALSPEMLNTYMRLAEAGLRAINRIDGQKMVISKNLLN